MAEASSDPDALARLAPPLRKALSRELDAPLGRRLVALRRDLHRHPELAFEEHRTADRLAAELEALGREGLGPESVERVAGTGLVARFAGRDRGAPLVAVRGDIDGLPIHEETGAPFASEEAGRMHACGHDVHASWALGAGALLAARPAAGDVLVLLQPAEENARGARALLEAGALDGVSAIFGGHVDLRFELGTVVAQAGPLAAATDNFEIELIGRGAHGARPHESADPVVGAAALVGALQTVVSRRLDPSTPAVLTVGRLEAGTSTNIIPERAYLAGTLRSMDPAAREALRTEVPRIAEGIAAAHGLEARVTLHTGPPALINHETAAAWAHQACLEVLGEGSVRPLGITNMAGEDFASYLERVPGCFLRIGARHPGDPAVAAHSPRFLPADESVLVGAAVLAGAARVASAALAGS